MKAAFLSAFVCLLLLTLVAGRNRPAPTPAGRIVLTWVSDSNPARQEQVRLFRVFCRARGHPDIDVHVDPDNRGMDKVVIQSVAGIGPDMFDVRGRSEAISYAEAGICEDVTALARRGGYGPERMWPVLGPAILVDGRQYSQPTNCTPTVLFYNKDIFDRYGVPYPKGDWSWDEFVRTARRVTRQRADGRGYDCFGVMGISLDECVWQAGGHFYSPDGLRCTLDSPEAVAGAKYFYDLQHTYHVMPTSSEENALASSGGFGAGAINYFMGGRLAMIDIGRWAIIQFRQAPGLRFGIVALPHGRVKANTLQWRATAVNRNARHKWAAELFQEFLSSPEYCRQVNESGDSIAPIPEHVNTERFLHDARHPEDEDNRLWITEMAYAHDVDVTPYANPFVTTRMVSDQAELMRGDSTDPETAMRTAARQINALIQRNIARDPLVRQRYLQRHAIRAGRMTPSGNPT